MRVSRLRSCYETDCLFYPGQVIPSRIRWYFVDSERPRLPFPNAFTPNVWLDDPEGDQEVGEVPGAPREWVDGAPPFPVSGGPACGTAEDFAGRTSWRADVPIRLNVYGGLACCGQPPPPFVFFNCQYCPDGASSDYTLTVEDLPNLPGSPFLANGVWRVSYVGNCTWQSDRIPATMPADPNFWWQYVLRRFPGQWSLSIFGQLGRVPIDFIADTSICLGDIRMVAPRETFPPWLLGGPFHAAIQPGIAGPGRFGCAGFSGALPASLVLRIPATVLGTFSRGHLRAADYPCGLTGPCTWSGTVYGGPPLVAFLPFAASLRLQRDGSLTVTLVFLNLTPPGRPSYITPPGWDGSFPTSLALQPLAVVPTWTFPQHVTVFVPGSPPE